MQWLGQFRRRLAVLFHRGSFERELEEEMQSHLAMQAEDRQEAGLAPEDAQHAARRQFGNPTLLKEASRGAWEWAWIETTMRDLRYAFRTLARTPGFSAVAVLSLALGLGANTALFSVMDVMLLRPLPVKEPRELVDFIRSHPSGARMGNLPYPVFPFFQRNHTALAEVLAIRSSDAEFRAGGAPELASAHQVSGSFFPALGVNPIIGRAIGPDDDRPGAAKRVAVLSHAFWSRRFGRDPAVAGATVRLYREPYTIIGVMPPDFFGADRSRLPDLWVPLAVNPKPYEVWVLGRLKPGISSAQARSELEPLFRQALESLRDDIKQWPARERDAFLAQRLLVESAANGTVDLRWTYWDYSGTLKILAGLSGLVLLIACTNLANLLMARTASRAREIGIRLAIGAGRSRLARQFLTESLLIALLAGSFGLLVAAWGHRLLIGFLVRDPQAVALDFRLDQRVLGFGLAISLLTGLLFGLLPAIRLTRGDVAAAIHGGMRQRHAGRMPLGRTLLTVQVALSTVLLIGAGLFARSLRNLAGADLGLDGGNLVMIDIRAPAGKTVRERLQFWSQVTARTSALPGVRSVALAGNAAFGRGGWTTTVWFQPPGRPARDVPVSSNAVSPGFFATAGIPLLLGREFGVEDRADSPPVAVVNQTFARRLFGDENPIGKRFGNRGRDSIGRCEVVGLIAGAKYGTVREKARPMIYVPLSQSGRDDSMVLHVRAAGVAAALLPRLGREIAAVDLDALITNPRTLPNVVWSLLRQDRMFAVLAGFFALLALMLSGIGIYGVVAYRVARRTSEIGIRMALGARRETVLWLVLREMLVVLIAGAVVGVPVAFAVARLIRGLLFGLEPSDPVTIACASASLLAAGGLAALLPALRASRIAPVEALRHE